MIGGPGTSGGSGGTGTTRGPGAGTGGNGGAVDDSLGGPSFSITSLSVPAPVVAWLWTTIGGIVLFLFLVRRRPRDDSPSLATFVLESPTSAAPPAAVIPPPAPATPPMASMASANKPSKPPKRARASKPAGQEPATGQASAAALAPAALAPAALARAAAVAVAPASAFSKRPAKGVERVFVSYQGVRMAEMPDEFSPMLARLERGDEVEIVGSEDGYLNVRTPVGLTGWIPRVTVTGVRPTARGGPRSAPN